MLLDFCAVCGSTEDLNNHHFTARILGGNDDERNMITLCHEHHCEIHSKNYRDKINHSELTKEGLRKAKERGLKLGKPENLIEYNERRVRNQKKYVYEHKDLILSFYNNGFSYRQICQELENLELKTPGGTKKWYPIQITRIIKRIEMGLIE